MKVNQYNCIPANILIGINNYDIVYFIHKLIQNKRLTITLNKVKAHIGLILNERADILAKEAAKNNCIEKDSIPPYANISTLYKNNVNTATNPKQILRKETQEKHMENSTTCIEKHHNPQNSYKIDIKNTILTTQNNSGKKNTLDASYAKESKFRIEMINNTLPVLTLVKEYYNKENINTKCPRCFNQEEDADHITCCTDTTTKISSIITETMRIAEERLKLPQNKKITIDNLYKIIEYLKNKNNLNNEPIIKGIITENFKNDIRNIIDNKLNTTEHAVFITECWLSAFYTIIWKPRCRLVYKRKNKHNTKDSHKAKMKGGNNKMAHSGNGRI